MLRSYGIPTTSPLEFTGKLFQFPYLLISPYVTPPPNKKLVVLIALKLCSNPILVEQELTILKGIAFDRGFSNDIIDRTVKSLSKSCGVNSTSSV